jgi:DNA-binding CsgD family transcriptional regulator
VPPAWEHPCRPRSAGRLEDEGFAIEWFADIGAELLAAEAWVEASLAYETTGDRRSSRRCEIRADELLADSGAQTPPLSVVRTRSGLTPRELEIASLAAEGLATSDIAARCTLSVRTVDNYLHHVYGKLGIAGRDELVAALRRHSRD